MANTKIVLNRQSDLILDNALITNPQGIVLTDISGVSEAVASINSATSADISAEASARVAGDVSLASELSAEASARVVAETSLQNNIDAEASTGLVRDNAEASTARAAEQSLATDLIAEQSRAESAELSLNAKVENVISNIDPAALDSLTEIVGAFQSADGDINNAITALGSAATVAVENEASIRLAADQSLAGDLSSEIADREAAVSLEEAARISGDSSLELELSAEIEARISDVDAEQARAESAEASLSAAKLDLAGGTMSGNINMDSHAIENITELNGANGDMVYLGTGAIVGSGNLDLNGNKLTNVPTPIDGVDATNKTYVDSADASLAADLSSEVSARLDAGTSVSAELSISVSDRVAADESLASEIESLAATDEQTIELNTADNTIRLKEYVAAPESGVRTFAGEVDIESVLRVAGVDVMAAMSTEVSDRIVGDESLAAAKLDLAGGTMSGAIDMGNQDITNADEIKANWVQTNILGNNTGDYVRVFTALDFENNNAPINLAPPSAGGDATNKTYVDAGDASIMSIVNNVISNTDAAALDSLTEVVAAFQSADSDLNGAITDLANAATVDLSAETSRAISAEESLAAAKLNLAGGTMSGAIDMNENGISNAAFFATIPNASIFFNNSIVNGVGNPIVGTDAANKDYVDGQLSAEVSRAESAEASLDAAKLNLAGGTMSGDINMGAAQITNVNVLQTTDNGLGSVQLSDSTVTADKVQINKITSGLGNVTLDNVTLNAAGNKILNLGDPTNDYDAAHKLYVDSVTSNLSSDLSTGLSAEIARAESAEASLAEELSSEVSYIMANTDLTAIDSFAEVVADLSSEVARAESAEASLALDFANIYAKHVALTQTANGVITEFSLVDVVREGSELIYLNGLLLDSEDYTANIVDGMVSSVTFFIAPSTGDKVRAYGVY